jgi:hypothetical protein
LGQNITRKYRRNNFRNSKENKVSANHDQVGVDEKSRMLSMITNISRGFKRMQSNSDGIKQGNGEVESYGNNR